MSSHDRGLPPSQPYSRKWGRLFSAQEAKNYLGVSLDHLLRRRAAGKPPAFFRDPGSTGKIWYSERDLDAYLDSIRFEPESTAGGE